MSRVYVVQGCNGMVKIGISGSVGARMQQLQAMCCCKLHLLGSAVGGREQEMMLHQKFAKEHDHGEWFTLTPPRLDELMKVLEALPSTARKVKLAQKKVKREKIISKPTEKQAQALVAQGIQSAIRLKNHGSTIKEIQHYFDQRKWDEDVVITIMKGLG